MKKQTFLICLLVALFAAGPVAVHSQDQQDARSFGIVIHGGAGTITREKVPPEKEKAYREKLYEALHTGYAILEKGGTSLDAVEAAVRVLEDSPLFNAGKGAVLTSDGKHELDASIMDGKTLAAGAVAGLRHIRNPISLARLVMEKSPHVMLIGEGAEAFARKMGIPLVSNRYFRTPERWKAYQKIKAREKEEKKKQKSGSGEDKKGTVGAVALDRQGNLAAATSTGGMMNKKFGRVGDAPIIGAGTYANNRICAVSCTGWGEYFIRVVVAHDIAALMDYQGMSLEKAAALVLEKAAGLGGDGGLIGIDVRGNVTMPFNTAGMFRAYKKSDGSLVVKMYPGPDSSSI